MSLETLVRRIATQVRWRRPERYSVRGLPHGSMAGALLLALKFFLGPWALTAAGISVVVGLLAGAAWGATKRVPLADAARLADRHYGLQDRVTTALEWSARADRTSMVDSLVADATARVAALAPRQVIERQWPREARLLPLPLLGVLVLLVTPPIPLPSGRLLDLSPSSESEETRDRPEAGTLEQEKRPLPRTAVKTPSFEERDYMQRGMTGAGATAGDLSAVFKDTSLAKQRPDFNSFLKKGDERLKLVEQVDRLPDLQSDFTASQYKMVFKKSKALTGGLRPDQISPQKLKELLEEMERLGRKGGGNVGSEVSEGMEALEYGQQDRALDAMEKALNKLRAMEEQQRSGKNLRGGRESERGRGSDRDRGRSGGGGADDQDFGEGEGLLPGKGKSPNPKGEASQRLRASPYDVGVEGESRQGRKDGYDTNMTGRSGKMPSRLGYLGVIGQYRKQMEDTLAREQVPRDFHGQIRDYFQSLVDASRSMGFGQPQKLEYAARLAAALGFVGLVNHERIGLGILRDRVSEGWAPVRGRNQFPHLADFLSQVEADGTTNLNDGLGNYARRAREPGLAVVISDLLDPGGFEAGLRALLERRFEVHVIHLLSAEELNPTLTGDLRLEDSETGEGREISVDGDALRGYRERLHAFLERVETFCHGREIGYRRVSTDAPMEDFLLAQLRGLLLS